MAVTIVTHTQIPDAKEPQVAVGAANRIYVAFGAGNAIYASVSHNQGRAYQSPVRLPSVGSLSLGMRRGPRIVATANGAVITAVLGKNGNGKDGDLLAWHTVDNGKTWRTAGKVNDVGGATREGLHAMAVAPNRTIACAWLDLREQGTRIFAAFSRDGGNTWGRNIRIYRSPSGTVCECCHPSLAYDSQSRLYIMWRNLLAGSRDMYLSDSNDDGKTFSAAKKLGRGTWPLNACPMDGGSLSVTKRGEVLTFWRREETLFLAKQGMPEKSIEEGQQGWMATTPAGVYLIWLRTRPGNLMLLSPNAPSPLRLAENANDPVIASGRESKTIVVAAWSDNQGIHAARV